ncbi:MAG: cyclase family protein [Proteobacteria bacterium]|nr:cyclase family protein [Pseudomonadota bacterium]
MNLSFPYSLVDLTHTISSEIPTWNGTCGFFQDIKLDYDPDPNKLSFRVQQLKMHAGIGTHIDAPCHCIPGGMSVDQLSLKKLIAPCVVIDISNKAHERYSLSVQDVKDFENEFGQIQEGTFIIVYTGWQQYWTDVQKYRNNFVFPSVSKDACLYLKDKNIVGLGIDTISPDRPEDGFLVHEILLGSNMYIVENIANAKKLPPVGAFSCALPIKTKDGSEAPIRLIGFIPKK